MTEDKIKEREEGRRERQKKMRKEVEEKEMKEKREGMMAIQVKHYTGEAKQN